MRLLLVPRGRSGRAAHRSLSRGLGALLAAIVASTAIAAPARADATSDATALRQFDEGRAAFEKGQYEAALASFNASLQALPSPNTRLYIARCHRSLGHTASAFTNFHRAANEAADRLNATGEKRYGATRDAALAEAAEVEHNVPHVVIAVPSDVPDAASIKLDDAEVPRSAWGIAMDVDPGAHTITATGPRRTPFSTRIQLAAAQQLRVDVKLARIPTATFSLAFRAKPAGLAAEVDGHPVDPAQLEAPNEVDAGEHHVLVHAPGYVDFQWHDSLTDGSTTRVEVALKPNPMAGGGTHGTPKWLFYSVAGVSLVALGVGAYFGIDATTRASTEKGKDPLQRDPAEQDKIKSEATTANVLFVAGAAVAAGAGVLAFTTDWKGGSAKTGARVYPLIGSSSAGIGVTGGF
jgi:hypothetical protein